MTKFYDTCALLDFYPEILKEKTHFYVALTTIRELEAIKTSGLKDTTIKYKARKLLRALHENSDMYSMKAFEKNRIDTLVDELGLPSNNDNTIIATAKLVSMTEDIEFVTGDLSCYFIAQKFFAVNAVFKSPSAEEVSSNGFVRVTLETEEFPYTSIDEFMQSGTYGPGESGFGLLKNQYLSVYDVDGEAMENLRWDGESYHYVMPQPIHNDYMGRIVPRNMEQEMLFDLFQDRNIPVKVVLGIYGSGKTFLALVHALELIRRQNFDGLVFIRNNIEVKNTNEIGALPGTMREKMLQWMMPLADHLGGVEGLELMLDDGVVEPLPLGVARGRDIKRKILFCDEAENLTREHAQLLLGRVGDDSEIWFAGDLRQVDGKVFEENNGLRALVSNLSGNESFGMIRLSKSERSKVSELANLLD